MGPKTNYSGRLYVRLQESLYAWFGYLGSVLYILAILCTIVLAISLRSHYRRRWCAASAAGLQHSLAARSRLPSDDDHRLKTGWCGCLRR